MTVLLLFQQAAYHNANPPSPSQPAPHTFDHNGRAIFGRQGLLAIGRLRPPAYSRVYSFSYASRPWGVPVFAASIRRFNGAPRVSERAGVAAFFALFCARRRPRNLIFANHLLRETGYPSPPADRDVTIAAADLSSLSAQPRRVFRV